MFIYILKKNFLKIYESVTTIFENLLYKSKFRISRNYLKLPPLEKFEYLIDVEKNLGNQFIKRHVLTKTSVNSLCELILNKYKNKIYKNTGFNYRITYFLLWSTYNIPKSMIDKDIYANHFHFDKSFSSNMRKIFILINNVTSKNGPLTFIINKKVNQFVGNKGDCILINTNQLMHKAGNPEKNRKRIQLMLQLIPSKKFEISKKIYERQFSIEPKFTSFRH